MADPLFLLFPFFYFFISIGAQSNPTYPNCPSYTCGKFNISYPFWRTDAVQPQLCGYHGFGINCITIDETNHPIIKFGSNSYYVDNIFYQVTSIILIDENLSPIDPVRYYCPTVPHNIDFQSLPLKFTEYNVNLSFHINCNGIPDFASEIPCLDSRGRKSCVNVMNSETEEFDWSNYSCGKHVVKTVSNKSLPDRDRLGRDYGGVLSRGFELNWWGPESCGKCEETNGRCGYNYGTGESMCFCSDGRTTTDDCKKGTTTIARPSDARSRRE